MFLTQAFVLAGLARAACLLGSIAYPAMIGGLGWHFDAVAYDRVRDATSLRAR